MNLKRINPLEVYRDLKEQILDLKRAAKYRAVIKELIEEKTKLAALGLSYDDDGNLYFGVDLNPEFRLYSETSTEQAEIKLISEKMLKYNDFLAKEGILDYAKADYDRVNSPDYYGYIIQISYDYRVYRKKRLIYDVAFLFGLATIALLTGTYLITTGMSEMR